MFLTVREYFIVFWSAGPTLCACSGPSILAQSASPSASSAGFFMKILHVITKIQFVACTKNKSVCVKLMSSTFVLEPDNKTPFTSVLLAHRSSEHPRPERKPGCLARCFASPPNERFRTELLSATFTTKDLVLLEDRLPDRALGCLGKDSCRGERGGGRRTQVSSGHTGRAATCVSWLHSFDCTSYPLSLM